MKKFVAIILTLIFALSTVGCGGSKPAESTKPAESSAPAASEKTSIDVIKEAGKLVMATSADYPPFEGISDDGKEIVGFDVDIAKAVADKIGVALEVKNMDFDGLLEALNQGKADMVASGMSANPEREKSVDFSEVYFVDEFLLVVKDGNEAIKTAADMNGKKIGVQLGTTCEAAAQSIAGVEIKSMDKVDMILLEVQSGRLDGAVINLTVALEYLKTMKGLKAVEIPELNKAPEGYAVAVKEGNKELVAVINETIRELKSSGQYDKLIEKWGLNSK